MVKSLPEMWETWVRSLGQEDSLEQGMATHSSILAWKIPWMEEPARLLHPWDFPLKYSCLENPMDGGAWQAAVHELAKTQT